MNKTKITTNNKAMTISEKQQRLLEMYDIANMSEGSDSSEHELEFEVVEAVKVKDIDLEGFLTISDCMDKTITTAEYTESFDKDTVLYLLKNQHLFKKHLIKKDGDYRPFERLQSYYNNSYDGEICVNYNKKEGDYGRLFSGGALSLQCLERHMRGSIAGDFYYDIDFINCHPVILKYICKMFNFDCKYLSQYIEDRETFIEEIIEANKESQININRDYVKSMYLSIINGGTGKYEQMPVKNTHAKKFRAEMGALHTELMECDWFPNIRVIQKELRKNDKDKGEYNLSGSVLNKAMCVYEDFFLFKLVEYFKELGVVENNAVLCFDGVMIPKKNIKDLETLNEYVESFNKAITEEYDMGLQISIKKFKKFPNLPETIPKGILKDYTEDNGYYWHDFIDTMTRKIWSNFDKLAMEFQKHINRVLVRIYEGDFYLKKLDDTNPVHISQKVPNEVFRFKKTNSKKQTTTETVSLQALMFKFGYINSIDTYDRITFIPGKEAGKREFNTWTGFQANLLKPEEVDTDRIEPVLELLKTVWCNHDEKIFNYLLSWFHMAFTRPYIKTKVGIILYSQKKQIGKGVFINEFLVPLIYGKMYAMSVNGVGDVVGNFNSCMMNKLLVNCDELQNLTGGKTSFTGIFNKMKKIITDSTITIEPKGCDKICNYPDYTNFIASTNFTHCFFMERGDARYLALECSGEKKGDFPYFTNLCDNVFTPETADHFFSYCYHMNVLGRTVDTIRNIPMTKLKEDMIEMCLASPLKFILEIKNLREQGTARDEYGWRSIVSTSEKIKAMTFYKYYKEFCDEENEKAFSKTAFGKSILSVIEKKKSSCMYYMLETITI